MSAKMWLQKHPNEIVLCILWAIVGIIVYEYYTGNFAGLVKLVLMMLGLSIGAITIIFTIGYCGLRYGFTKAKADAELEKLEDDLIKKGGLV